MIQLNYFSIIFMQWWQTFKFENDKNTILLLPSQTEKEKKNILIWRSGKESLVTSQCHPFCQLLWKTCKIFFISIGGHASVELNFQCYGYADEEMQEEIDTYVSKGQAAFTVFMLVCTEFFLHSKFGLIFVSSLLIKSCNILFKSKQM